MFDQRRIIARHDVPEIFAHGPRLIEVIDGNIIRITLCVDEPQPVAGMLPLFRPVARVLTPADHYIWNTLAQIEWSTRHGIFCRTPCGPIVLRPRRSGMH